MACIYIFLSFFLSFKYLPQQRLMDSEGCEGIWISSLVYFLHKVCTVFNGYEWREKRSINHTGRKVPGTSPLDARPSKLRFCHLRRCGRCS